MRSRRGLVDCPALPYVGGDARFGEGARAFSGLFVWWGTEAAVEVAAALVAFQFPRLVL